MEINLADFLKKKKRTLIVVSIVLLVMIMGNNFIYQVQKEKTGYLERKIEEEETKNRLVREIMGLNKEFGSYKKRVPVQRDVFWLIRKIGQLAKGAQIKVVSLQPKQLDRQEGYVRVPLEIEVECGYHELGEFLSNIENSQEFVRLDSLQFLSRGGNGQISEIEDEHRGSTASLVVSTIYLEE